MTGNQSGWAPINASDYAYTQMANDLAAKNQANWAPMVRGDAYNQAVANLTAATMPQQQVQAPQAVAQQAQPSTWGNVQQGVSDFFTQPATASVAQQSRTMMPVATGQLSNSGLAAYQQQMMANMMRNQALNSGDYKQANQLGTMLGMEATQPSLMKRWGDVVTGKNNDSLTGFEQSMQVALPFLIKYIASQNRNNYLKNNGSMVNNQAAANIAAQTKAVGGW